MRKYEYGGTWWSEKAHGMVGMRGREKHGMFLSCVDIKMVGRTKLKPRIPYTLLFYLCVLD